MTGPVIISTVLIMQGRGAVEGGAAESAAYTPAVARNPKPNRGPRPKQGAHLLALRQKAGLTQIELAEAVGVQQTTIVLWEWSNSPPRSRDLPGLARALGVHVNDLLVDHGSAEPLSTRPGPVGQVQRVFEEVRQLPRKQQKKVLEMVIALVEQYKRGSGTQEAVRRR